MKIIQRIFWNYFIPLLLASILYPYIKTIRVTFLDKNLRPFKRDETKPYIYAHFHEDIPLLSLTYCFSDFCTMASRSKDGELIARVLSLLGYTMVRGSSKFFGGESLKALVHAIHSGKNLALAVDGPRGPRNEVKKGVMLVASQAKVSIIAASAGARHKIIFKKSWDQIWFPLPFSKAVIICGDPIHFESRAEDIKAQLLELKEKAHDYFLRCER